MNSRSKPVRWSLHGLARVNRQDIDVGEVLLTIEDPEFVAPGQGGRSIYMRRSIDPESGKPMLIRVVIEELAFERVVISVIFTSKVAKYLREVSR